MFRSSVLLAASVGILLTAGGSIEAQNRKSPLPQKYGDHLEIEVTGIKQASQWSMFPGMQGAPGISAGPGQTLLLVEFRVKDLNKGVEDTDASFADFELEDAAGQKHACPIKRSDVREIPFPVPEGTKAKVFRISGLSFDVGGLTPR